MLWIVFVWCSPNYRRVTSIWLNCEQHTKHKETVYYKSKEKHSLIRLFNNNNNHKKKQLDEKFYFIIRSSQNQL